jgi:two-component system secretion response regulator SsrB
MIKKNSKILIIDDHQVLIHGIEEIILNNIRDIEILKAYDESTAIALINNIHDIDLVICDLNLGREGKSFRILSETQRKCISSIVFTAYENKIFIEECKKYTVLSYVCKRSGEIELLKSIVLGLEGKSHYCPISIQALLQEDVLFQPKKLILTYTEKALVKCWGSGLSNNEIIERFNYNENTLRTHRRHILHKNKCNFEQLLACYNSFHENETVDLSILFNRK